MAQMFRFPQLERELAALSPEQQLQQAYQHGLDAGLAEGLKQGKAEADQQAKHQAELAAEQRLQQELLTLGGQFEQQISQLSRQLQHLQQQQTKQLEQAVLHLIEQLSRLTLEAELSLQPEHLQRAVQQALPLLQQQDKIQAVWLAPADLNAWQQLSLTDIGDIPLHADNNLTPGTARLQGDYQLHLVDFQQRLQRLLPQLRRLLLNEVTDAAG